MKPGIAKYQKEQKKSGKSGRIKKSDHDDAKVTLSQLEDIFDGDEEDTNLHSVQRKTPEHRDGSGVEQDFQEFQEEVLEMELKAAEQKSRMTKDTAAARPIPQAMGLMRALALSEGKGTFAPARPDEKTSPLGSREEIIREYAPLIKFIAQKIAARLPANIELDDLISAGVIGLMDAIEKYDPTRDNKFKTYAEFRVRGAILDELRSQDWVPRSVREKSKLLERTYSKLENEKGRPPSDEEICEDLNVSQDEYYSMLNQVRSVSLLSYEDLSTFSKTDKRLAMGGGENSKNSNPFAEVNTATLKQMIAGAIKDLPEKQRLVLSLYYYEDLNLKEIGRVLDVTESRVSQLHTQAILKLRSKLKHNFDDFLILFS